MTIKKAFTLIELVIVIVIIGILATLGITQYGSEKEKVLDKEAFANLKLIQAAQKIYKMEQAGYYDSGGGPNGLPNFDTTGALDGALKLMIPYSANANWYYSTRSTGCSMCIRNGSDSRTFSLEVNSDADPGLGGRCAPP